MQPWEVALGAGRSGPGQRMPEAPVGQLANARWSVLSLSERRLWWLQAANEF